MIRRWPQSDHLSADGAYKDHCLAARDPRDLPVPITLPINWPLGRKTFWAQIRIENLMG